jgi:MFS transporter, ACS family, pantothenate transporter
LFYDTLTNKPSTNQFAWAHEICSDDNEERALVTGAMNEMAYVFQAWLPLVIWQQVEAPRYPKGFPTMIGIAIGLLITTAVIKWLHEREKLSKKQRVSVQEELGAS